MDENTKELTQEAEELGRQMAESYDKGYLESLKKANTKVTQAFKTRYEAIGYQLKYGLITEEEYYDKLAKIRDMYFSRDTQEWHRYTEEIFDYKVGALNDYKEAVEKNLEEILKISRDKFSSIEKEQGSYADKLKDYAGDNGIKKYQVSVDNYYPNGGTLKYYDYSLTDFEKEIEKLKSFNQSIENLKEKATQIAPETFETFFAGLREMPIDDAKAFADILVKKNDDEFKKYFELYQERNDIAEVVSANLYESDFKNVAKTLKEELKTEFDTIPEDFLAYGELTGQNFAEGFRSEVEGLFDEIKLNLELANTQTGEPDTTNQNVFSPVYYFFGDRAKTSRTRLQAKNDALYQYMRGLE